MCIRDSYSTVFRKRYNNRSNELYRGETTYGILNMLSQNENGNILMFPFLWDFFCLIKTVKLRNCWKIRLSHIRHGFSCLRNRTKLRFDIIHSFMVCAQTSAPFDTQNPENSRFSTAHAYKYKTKRQAKMKWRQQKKDILLISHQSTHVPENQIFFFLKISSIIVFNC